MNEAFEKYSKSIYAMGNPHKLSDTQCEDVALSIAISEYIDSDDVVDTGKFIGKLKKSKFNFDIKHFNKGKRKAKKHEPEICKIIYFFYALQYKLIPEILNKFIPDWLTNKKRKRFDVIDFLSSPSMESIDYSHLGLESLGLKTYYGEIIRLIKSTLEKEMSPQAIKIIKDAFFQIASEWHELHKCASKGLDVGEELDYDYVICALDSILHNYRYLFAKKTYQASAIETLYLKVLQHEFKGQLKDILVINRQSQTGLGFDLPQVLSGIFGLSVPSVPSSYVTYMRSLYYQVIDIECIEEYIYDCAPIIEDLIYLNRPTDKEDRERIRESTDKVFEVLGYCIRAKKLIIMQSEFTTLLIIACLQAILADSKNEEFDYTIYYYQELTGKHYKPKVQAALKNDDYTLDALKVYWARKVTDHLYANIGRDDLKTKFRELENKCAEILLRIYSRSSVSEMLLLHEEYYEKIKPRLLCYT